jgi:capsid protein
VSAGTAYKGAASSRLYADWAPWLSDVNDEYWIDGSTLAARSWDLFRNDPYARAMVETVVGGILGQCGLQARSHFQEDGDPDTSDREREVRRQIEDCLRRATLRRRFDAGGTLTFRDMCGAMIRARFCAGNAFAVRVFKPARPDAYQGTCWRVIDPARVNNPNNAPDTPGLYEGVELGADGSPVAIHVQSAHPNLQRQFAQQKWERIPIYAPDGSLNVVHYRAANRPEQILGVSEFAPVIHILKYLSDITWFWVVAKKMQASNAIIVECDDPAAAAKADRNGALLASSVGIKPGMKYYVKTGWKVHFMNPNFQGQDYGDFRNKNLEAACSAWGLPYVFVLAVLEGTNLSASRSAIGQFYGRMEQWQDEFIAQVLQPWNESILREEIAFGKTNFGTDDFELISRLRYVRPPRISPDDAKDATAAETWLRVGVSPTSVMAKSGRAFEDETSQKAQDIAFAEAQGIDAGTGHDASPSEPAKPAADAPAADGAVDEPAAAGAAEVPA